MYGQKILPLNEINYFIKGESVLLLCSVYIWWPQPLSLSIKIQCDSHEDESRFFDSLTYFKQKKKRKCSQSKTDVLTTYLDDILLKPAKYNNNNIIVEVSTY